MSYVLENKGYDSDGRCFPDFLGAEDRLLFERLIRFIHEKPGQPFYASAGLTRVTIRANSDPRRRVANGSVMKSITSNIPPGAPTTQLRARSTPTTATQ